MTPNLTRPKGQNAKKTSPRRAIFAFCDESDCGLFSTLSILYRDFERSFLGPISGPASYFAQWAGDVHKFGVHITLRGVAPVLEKKRLEWLYTIERIANQFAPIRLEGSRLFSGIPGRIVLTFEGPPQEKARFAVLSATLARAVVPMLRWAPISRSELKEEYLMLCSATLEEQEKKQLLQNLDEISKEFDAGNLSPLPDTPEYRLPLLVSIWKNKALRDALFEVGDPFAIYPEPHISILSAVNRSSSKGILSKFQTEFRELVGQDIQINRIYAMVEKTTSLVPVMEYDRRTRTWRKVQRPKWEVEKSFALKGRR